MYLYNYNRKTFALLLYILLGHISIVCADVLINEFLASNQNGITDWQGETSDWIEIYNPDSVTYSLHNHTLTDKPDNPDKWALPDITIQPQSYQLIWASGKDTVTGEEVHTNFKLSKSGEFIGLYDSTGTVIDSLSYQAQESDVSSGRYPDGDSTWQTFSKPSPKTENTIDLILTIDQPNGVYSAPLTVTMSTNVPGGVIRYTREGEVPKKWSNQYNGPVALWKTTALRAAVFVNDVIVTDLESRIYIINENPQLPVLALFMKHDDLWHQHFGIYENPYNSGIGWEKPVRVVLWEDNETKFDVPAGIRIHGQGSRSWPKKKLRLYFRKEYGMSRLEYPLFPENGIDEFKRLILYSEVITDVFYHAVYENMGYEVSKFKPVVLYLNREYWGIYWIRERIDKYYIEDYFGWKDFDLLRSEWRDPWLDVREGDRLFWDTTMTYFNTHSLSNQANYNYVKNNLLNIKNFTDYYQMAIFAARYDWPHTNIDRFRDRTGVDPRWYHISWDADETWKLPATRQTLAWALRSEVRTDLQDFDTHHLLWSTLFIRRLLENENYYHYFINRFMDLMNTCLSFGVTNNILTDLTSQIEAEIPAERTRWDTMYTHTWYMQKNMLSSFAWGRPSEIRKQLSEHFQFNNTQHTITIQPSNGGHIKLNSLTIDSPPFSGIYFQDIPITLTAIPNVGQKFNQWSDTLLPKTPTVSFNLTGDLDLHAIFTSCITLDSISVHTITDSSAIVSIQTSETTNASIRFGTDTTHWQTIQNSGSQAVNHQFQLSALPPFETCYYQITAWNVVQDTITSQVDSFKTLPSPPVIIHMAIDSISTRSARVTCQCNEPVQTMFYLGTDSTAMGAFSDTVLQELHTRPFQNLMDTTRYYVKAICANIHGLSAISSLMSFTTRKEYTFPTAAFAADTTSGTDSLTVHFDDTSTGDITNWLWDFGNGDTSHVRNPVFTYSIPDTYDVCLTVTGPAGSDTLKKFNYIDVLHASPIANFTADTTLGIMPLTVEFIDSSAGNITTWYWNFGDGDTSSIQNPSHTYTDPDTYSVSLIVSGPGGMDSLMSAIQIIVLDKTTIETQMELPTEFSLSPVYPNPFNPEANIRYALPSQETVQIHIFNIRGEIVEQVNLGIKEAGYHHWTWDANRFSTGTYFVRIQTGQFHTVRKCVLMK